MQAACFFVMPVILYLNDVHIDDGISGHTQILHFTLQHLPFVLDFTHKKGNTCCLVFVLNHIPL